MGGDIYMGDCLEDMKLLPDHSVDMILCDLPYGTTGNKWDSVIPFSALWFQYLRVTKDNAAIVLTAQCPFDKTLGASRPDLLRYEWIWEKSRATGHMNAKGQPMKNHENVLVFYRKPPTYNPQGLVRVAKVTKQGKRVTDNYGGGERKTEYFQEFGNYPKSIVTVPSESNTVHPTQKPVALFEYLIKTYTNEWDTVLDNCAGSGTTGVACVNTNRKYILMEKEPKYIEIIQKRLGLIQEAA